MFLATGAELRVTGPTGNAAVICVNGGQAAEVEAHRERVARMAR